MKTARVHFDERGLPFWGNLESLLKKKERYDTINEEKEFAEEAENEDCNIKRSDAKKRQGYD